MSSQDFTVISKRYEETSIIQNSAADILLALLDIKENECILDVGCGTGNLTIKLFDKSGGYIAGIDPSPGMIEESKKNYGKEIEFRIGSAEDISFDNIFNVIFCNSAFQWVNDANKVVHNFYNTLKIKGRVGIQAPGGREYCPNFIQAVNSVKNHERIGQVFNKFNSPWYFLNTATEYKDLFLNQGFKVPFCEIQTIETLHSPQEVYKIFASGAIAGYLNQTYYDCELNDEYINSFRAVVKDDFNKQAIYDGMVKLVFNRIFLIGIKE
jgi:trans-aconitate methyltransferase